MGLVGELSSARLRDELVLLLGEADMAASVLRLGDIGLAGAIHPHLSADPETVELLRTIDDLRERYAPGEPAWRLRLGVLARRLTSDELYEWFGRLKLRRRDADLVADAVTVAPKLVERLSTATSASDAHRVIARHDPDGALLALALAPAGRPADWLRRYLTELRGIHLEISGSDLAELGLRESPRVGEVLDELLRRKIDGDLPDGRSSELEAARGLIGAATR
jgi:tRNA nucleotidyltransferase (CCA-adding enzyme)